MFSLWLSKDAVLFRKKNKTFLATFAIVLVLLAALFWLLWRTHTDLDVSNAHVELAGHVAGDFGYCIAAPLCCSAGGASARCSLLSSAATQPKQRLRK